LDADDRCPDEAGLRENQGCPDQDSDGDGVVDRIDRCPSVPGIAERLGCPDPGSDRAGIAALQDRRPAVPRTPEVHGGPDQDSDGDGIVDRKDKCVNEPETFNGFEDDDGCPDRAALAVLTQDRIEIRQPVQFNRVEFGTAKWKISRESYLLLASVANILVL